MKRRALVIGINNWQDTRFGPLRCAESDARDVKGVLERLQFDHVTELLGAEATQHNVLRTLNRLIAGLGEEDLFLLYVASHGITEKGGHYLLCWDALKDPEFVGERVGQLGIHSLTERMRKVGGFHRLIITDACRAALEHGRDGLAASFRGGECYQNLGRCQESELVGHVRLNSCEDGKVARELESHGLFTQAMLELWREKLQAGEPLWVNADFHEELGMRMQDLAETQGWPRDEQWPMFVQERPLPFPLNSDPYSSRSKNESPPSPPAVEGKHRNGPPAEKSLKN